MGTSIPLRQRGWINQDQQTGKMKNNLYTILVIDDEMITRMTLAALLEKPNFQVEMAEDGIQGLKLARQIVPDVILLDVMMPHMDGFETCKHIRSDPKIGEVPIIMITALDERDMMLKGLEAGADDFLSKPFDSLELEIRLRTLMRVDRYRHLLDERKKLQSTLAELSGKNIQLHLLSQQVLNAQENERRRIAIELHDEIGQLLTGLKLILEHPRENKSLAIYEAHSVAIELIQRVREMSLNLRPSALDDFGLFPALDGLIKRFASQTKIIIHHNINPLEDRRFDKFIEIAVFRMVQEALTNVARHAGVNEASVTLTITDDCLQVSIIDTGKGFDVLSKDTISSVGISGMTERMNMAGGILTLKSIPGEGTIVRVEFDLNGRD